MRPLPLQWSLFLISAYVPLCLHAIVRHVTGCCSWQLFMYGPRSRDPWLRTRTGWNKIADSVASSPDLFVSRANDRDWLAIYVARWAYYLELTRSQDDREIILTSMFSNSRIDCCRTGSRHSTYHASISLRKGCPTAVYTKFIVSRSHCYSY